MDFEQFCPEVNVPECDCSTHIRVTALVVVLVTLLIDCVTYCNRNNKIKQLTSENESLKSLILKSVDKAFVRMMKNGNDSDNEHDD